MTEPRTKAGPIPDGPYRVEWPSEQGGWFTIWGSGGWAIPIVALGVQSAMEHIATLLNREAEAAAGPREAIELCPECGGQYSDLPGHRRLAHNAAAGPRGTLTDAYSRGVEVGAQMEREAAAGPRDEASLRQTLETYAPLVKRDGYLNVDALLATIRPYLAEAAAGPRAEGLEVHVNDGSAHDRAMAWSEGHTAGYDEALAAGSRDEGLREAVLLIARHVTTQREDGMFSTLEADVRAALAKASDV